MRVAVVQLGINDHSRSANLRRTCEWLDDAAEADPPPEVLCLPGRCDHGRIDDQSLTLTAAMTDTFLECLAGRARDMGVAVVAGLCETDGHDLFDTAMWYDADGDVLGKHRRCLLDETEGRVFRAGGSISVLSTLFGPVALLGAQEACDPSMMATVAALGARVVFVPCCWATGVKRRPNLAELAEKHHLWCVLTNSVGSAGGDGGSGIINPRGEWVADAGQHEQVVHVTLALE